MLNRRNRQTTRSPQYVSLDKSADILHGTFKHYYTMAIDHHTKAATTSNMLLIIVGTIIGLVGLDGRLHGTVDLLSGFAVMVIGVFGAIWAWKQHERYHYWEHIAYEYQKELTGIVPELRMLERDEAYDCAAKEHAAQIFRPLFAKHIHDRYLWVGLHIIVEVLGIVLMVLSL